MVTLDGHPVDRLVVRGARRRELAREIRGPPLALEKRPLAARGARLAVHAARKLVRELSRELDLGKCPREIVLGTSAVHTAREFARELYLVAALRLMPPGNLLDVLLNVLAVLDLTVLDLAVRMVTL